MQYVHPTVFLSKFFMCVCNDPFNGASWFEGGKCRVFQVQMRLGTKTRDFFCQCSWWPIKWRVLIWRDILSNSNMAYMRNKDFSIFRVLQSTNFCVICAPNEFPNEIFVGLHNDLLNGALVRRENIDFPSKRCSNILVKWSMKIIT